MSFDLVRFGLPNTALLAALAVMPVLYFAAPAEQAVSARLECVDTGTQISASDVQTLAL